jgi:hypothetical protein
LVDAKDLEEDENHLWNRCLRTYARGRTGMQRLLLGSVAERVVHAAELPVVREPPKGKKSLLRRTRFAEAA